MTRAQAEEHQRKHGFIPKDAILPGKGPIAWDEFSAIDRMNKTEAEYALILEAMKRRGEILSYEYEGITLRWMVGEELIRYTPDFVVFTLPSLEVHNDESIDDARVIQERFNRGMKFIEVKGGFTGGKFERAVERFRHARTRWPMFQFEMHQKKAGQWARIY